MNGTSMGYFNVMHCILNEWIHLEQTSGFQLLDRLRNEIKTRGLMSEQKTNEMTTVENGKYVTFSLPLQNK